MGKIWLKKGQKNLNYSNILDAPRGKLPLYKKEVEFVLEVILVVEHQSVFLQLKKWPFRLSVQTVVFTNVQNRSLG